MYQRAVSSLQRKAHREKAVRIHLCEGDTRDQMEIVVHEYDVENEVKHCEDSAKSPRLDTKSYNPEYNGVRCIHACTSP